MRDDKMKKKTTLEDGSQIRYCKKCGRELASTNPYKKCENCRENTGSTIRSLVIAGVTLAGSYILGSIFGKKSKGE